MELESTLDQAAAPDRFAQIARSYAQFAAFGPLLSGLYPTSRYSHTASSVLARLPKSQRTA